MGSGERGIKEGQESDFMSVPEIGRVFITLESEGRRALGSTNRGIVGTGLRGST